MSGSSLLRCYIVKTPSAGSINFTKLDTMAESLFPNLGSGGGSSSQNNALFSFKAGKVVHTPLPDGSGKFNCTADPRRGLITLSRAQDRTLHLKWTDRTTGSVEEDRIVFPNSITLRAVNTGRPIDRVACLTLDGAQQMLFWMQDKENKDAENMARLVELVNSPAAVEAVEAERAQARAAAAAASGGAGGLPGTSGVGAEEWMRLMGLTRGGGDAAAAPAPAPSAFDSLGALRFFLCPLLFILSHVIVALAISMPFLLV